jgi:RNA polymerase sigma-70 factor (ECF subfamily)
MNEQRAIELCVRHRDPTGFEYLVRRYRREAFVHAATLLGNAHDAEDACQECFVKAFNALPGRPGLDGFYPWFYRILRNHCLNMLAKRQVRSRYAARTQADARQAPEFERSPSVFAAEGEDRELVRDVLRGLTPAYREILAMKYFESATYNDISQRLGIPRGTVMSRLYNARTAFRREYERRRRVLP